MLLLLLLVECGKVQVRLAILTAGSCRFLPTLSVVVDIIVVNIFLFLFSFCAID
jgi:hypothetical protein